MSDPDHDVLFKSTSVSNSILHTYKQLQQVNNRFDPRNEALQCASTKTCETLAPAAENNSVAFPEARLQIQTNLQIQIQIVD